MEKIYLGSDLLKDVADLQEIIDKIFKKETGNVLVTVSALGNSSFQLKTIAELYINNKQQEALNHFESFKSFHLSLANELLNERLASTCSALTDLFTEVEWLLYDEPVRSRDYYYAQILCCGELVSSVLLTALFCEKKFRAKWLDARDFIKTDSIFTAASIIKETTKEQIVQVLISDMDQHSIIITQHSIGSTLDNENTILNNSTENHLFHLV